MQGKIEASNYCDVQTALIEQLQRIKVSNNGLKIIGQSSSNILEK